MKEPLSRTHPELATEWHPTKNGGIGRIGSAGNLMQFKHVLKFLSRLEAILD
jgi:hypothetical protein